MLNLNGDYVLPPLSCPKSDNPLFHKRQIHQFVHKLHTNNRFSYSSALQNSLASEQTGEHAETIAFYPQQGAAHIMKILPKILILMMCMVPLGADELPTITLDEAIAAAAENNLDLQKAGIALNQAIRKQNSVMTTYMPTLGISGSASCLRRAAGEGFSQVRRGSM